MNTFVRLSLSLVFVAGLLLGGATVAAAAVAPSATASVTCTSTVLLPAGSLLVSVPGHAGSSNCALVKGDVDGSGQTAVHTLQTALKECNGEGSLVVDGSFGPDTMKALAAAQSLRGAKPDGMYGTTTRRVSCSGGIEEFARYIRIDEPIVAVSQ